MPRKPNHDRILSNLERKYDKNAAPTREYFTDMQNIQYLFKEGIIDREHAELLADNAKAHYQLKEEKRKEVKKPKETKAPRMPVSRQQSRGRTTGNLQMIDQGITAFISGVGGLFAIMFVAFVVL